VFLLETAKKRCDVRVDPDPGPAAPAAGIGYDNYFLSSLSRYNYLAAAAAAVARSLPFDSASVA